MTCCSSNRDDHRTWLIYLDSDRSVCRDAVSTYCSLARELESFLGEVDRSILHEEADAVANHVLVSHLLECLAVSKIPDLACCSHLLSKVLRNLHICCIPSWVTGIGLDDFLACNIVLVTCTVDARISVKLNAAVHEDTCTSFICSSLKVVT